MSITNNFHIVGYGYLHEVDFTEKKPIVRIQRSLPIGTTQESEEVWFNCRFADELKNSLVKLQQVVETNKTVLLHFSLKYKGFCVCYQGQSPENAAQIVIFHAELMRIQDVFVDGVKLSTKQLEIASI